jgi:hypothetical protein
VNDIAGFSITFTVSFISIIISTFICLMIIIITFITPNLRSPKNLLLCNTCLCTLFYSIISIINTIYFLEPTSTDWSCRIRGYLNYVALSLVIYSYVIQAISRLFWTVFYRYRYLLSIKCHVYLIVTQICLSFLIELSTIITKDITFHPLKICFVPMNYKIHVMYLLTIGYIVPISTVIILYTIIYRHTIRSTSNVQRSSSRTKRDAELARNILILLSIFVFSGIPTVIYVIVSSTTEFVPIILFLIAITTPPIAVAIEKIVTLILNKDIRNALKQRWIACCPNCLSPSNSVQPFTRTTNTNPTLKKWF